MCRILISHRVAQGGKMQHNAEALWRRCNWRGAASDEDESHVGTRDGIETVRHEPASRNGGCLLKNSGAPWDTGRRVRKNQPAPTTPTTLHERDNPTDDRSDIDSETQ